MFVIKLGLVGNIFEFESTEVFRVCEIFRYSAALWPYVLGVINTEAKWLTRSLAGSLTQPTTFH